VLCNWRESVDDWREERVSDPHYGGTWLLVLQAFLFGAIVNGLGLYGRLPMHAEGLFVTLGLTVIGALGMLVTATAHNTVDAATKQTLIVRDWLGKLSSEPYPPLFGEFAGYTWSTRNLPKVFGVMWAFVLALLFVGTILAACRHGHWHPWSPLSHHRQPRLNAGLVRSIALGIARRHHPRR
jgi:ABC-type amino acid transport system permease subunit